MAYQGRAFLQDVPQGNAPSRTLTLFSYQNGLDNISSQQNVSNESATNVLNMMYLEDGLIQKRYGTNPYNEKVYDAPVTFFDTFKKEDGSEVLITCTNNKVFAGDTLIATVKGKVSGVQVGTRYMFVDGYNLFSYEEIDGAFKTKKIVTPTNLEDALASKASKGDKSITVKDGTKFKAGMRVQIGERVIDNKGLVSDVPPPQILPVLKVEGNVVTFGEVIKQDDMFTETSTNTDDTSTNKTTSDTSEAEDETTIKESGDATGTSGKKTTTLSKRLKGKQDTVTKQIGIGVSIVHSVEKVKEEDSEITKYYRLDYTYDAGTKLTLFQEEQSYKYIGEWKTDTNNKWYEPCTHELEDAFLGLNILPEKPTYIAYIKNRVVLTGGEEEAHILYISETNNPYYFPASTGVTLPANGEEITGLACFHDSLVMARPSDMYVLYGSSNNTEFGDLFRLQRITTHTGCSNGNTMEVVHNYLFYLGSDGVVYRMNTTNTDVRMLSTSIVSKTVDLFKAPLNLTVEELKEACSTFNNEHYYLSVGNLVLVYSYRFQAWTVFDRLGVTYIGRIGEEIVWSKGNRLFHFDKTTFLDEGIDFNCFWESKLFDLELPVNYKYFKYISLVFDTYEHFDSTAKLIFEIDYEDVTLNHVFKNAISRWGKARWGVDRFATRNISKSLPIYVGRRGRLVKIKIHNGNNVKHIVQTLTELEALSPTLYDVAYVKETNTHYKYIYENDTQLLKWIELDGEEINQPIKLYNIEIEYSVRGRR